MRSSHELAHKDHKTHEKTGYRARVGRHNTEQILKLSGRAHNTALYKIFEEIKGKPSSKGAIRNKWADVKRKKRKLNY